MKIVMTLAIVSGGLFMSGFVHAHVNIDTSGFCGNQTDVFQCQTKKNKMIQVCKQDDVFTYQYGKLDKHGKINQPEKTIKQHLANLDTKTWNGMGASVNQHITFVDGNYQYQVFSSYDRSFKGKPTERVDIDFDISESGGVTVIKNNKILATINCKPESMQDHIEDALIP